MPRNTETGNEEMTKAIRIHQTGGPDAMRWEDIEVGAPGPDEVRIRHEAVGLNYIDIYFRTGLYPPPSLPFSPGMEGSGIVEAVGAEVDSLEVGDRVAYAAPPVGSYAEVRLMPAAKVVRVPAGIDSKQAAAMMLQGMTVEYLLRRTYPVRAGETILFHAAAGGVGLIACQWAEASRGDGHRNREQRREGGAGTGARLRSPHRLHEGGLHRAGHGPDGRRRGSGRVRRGRSGHVRRAVWTASVREECW